MKEYLMELQGATISFSLSDNMSPYAHRDNEPKSKDLTKWHPAKLRFEDFLEQPDVVRDSGEPGMMVGRFTIYLNLTLIRRWKNTPVFVKDKWGHESRLIYERPLPPGFAEHREEILRERRRLEKLSGDQARSEIYRLDEALRKLDIAVAQLAVQELVAKERLGLFQAQQQRDNDAAKHQANVEVSEQVLAAHRASLRELTSRTEQLATTVVLPELPDYGT